MQKRPASAYPTEGSPLGYRTIIFIKTSAGRPDAGRTPGMPPCIYTRVYSAGQCYCAVPAIRDVSRSSFARIDFAVTAQMKGLQFLCFCCLPTLGNPVI
jgi:hypothetical protein